MRETLTPPERAVHDDLLWGTEAIATEIGRPLRATFHLLANGRIPARKIGRTWVASRAALREFFVGDAAAR